MTTESTPDIKPRSRVVTDGIHAAPARGMFRAVGMGDDDFAKPQIGIASSWNEITPCNLSLNRLREKKRAKNDADTVALTEEMAECLASEDGPERSLDDRTVERVVNGYLENCGKTRRFAFVRRYYFGDGYDEIARYTGKSKGTVRTMLCRMRGELRELLEKEGISE